MKIYEIGFAHELGNLSLADAEIISNSKQDGTIGQKPVMVFSSGNNTIYFFMDNDKISALILLDGIKLTAIKNFTNQKGMIYSLLNYIVNIKNTKLIITPDEPLTSDGFKWIAKLIEKPSGLKITDFNKEPIDIDELEREWNKARFSGGDWHGETGIIIEESSASWKKRLQENEESFMPFIYFKTTNCEYEK